MSHAAFTTGLAKGYGPGARWYKADFHVHFPGVGDYEYKGPDAEALLGRALTDGNYGFAVIVKHETFPTRQELASLQKHCPRTTLIPGSEINILVDALSKKIGKDYFFHCIVAVDPKQEGEYDYVLRKAKETLNYRTGDYPAGFRSNVIDVAKFFRSHGALFIPAHLHQAKKPELSRSIDDLYDDDAFLGFVRDGAFSALEVREVATAGFFDGTRLTKEGLSIPKAVCVASSDAHHHDHIVARDRATWIRAEKAEFSELVAALSFPHRVSLAPIGASHPRVMGIHVVGSFIPDCWVSLNDGFNALIGAKGSGKTALLECLRFVLNATVPRERADQVQRHLTHILGSAGFVECLVEHANGERELITRRADGPSRIVVTNEKGDTKTVTDSGSMPFSASILGWHEIEGVADSPEARIQLLDRIGDAGAVRQLYNEIGAHVETARDGLPALQQKIKRLDTSLKNLWNLQAKRRSLKRLEEGELLELQSQYEWYLDAEQRLDGVVLSAAQRDSSLDKNVLSNIVGDFREPPKPDGAESAQAAIESVKTALRENGDREASEVVVLRGSLQELNSTAQAAKASLTQSFATFREQTYAPKVNALDPVDREILSRQIQVLEETKNLPLVERECQELLGDVVISSRQLKNLCDKICSKRDEVCRRREELLSELNKELPNIRLRFLRSANIAARDRFRSRHGADGPGFIEFLMGYGKPEAYSNLAVLFDRLSSLQLDESAWHVNRLLWDARFADLLDVVDDDDIEISLVVGKAGPVPIQNLSAGQRSVAVFPLLLRNTRGPLMIDQPEDNLDNRYIADVIAPDLLKQKRHQQFVVTSHNANLVVLTDADLVMHVESDGTKSTFPTNGFLSCPSSLVRDAVLDVLDGGETALAARQKKYGVGS